MKRSSKYIFLTAIAAAGLLIAGLCLELVCRVSDIPFSSDEKPFESRLGQFDPELGWSYVPMSSYEITVNPKVGHPYRVHIGPRGYRISDPGRIPDPDAPTVLFIGGSFTFGHGLDYDETFTGQLTQHGEAPLQYVNLGVQGFGTDQALLMLIRQIQYFTNVQFVVYTYVDEHQFRNGNYDRRLLHPKNRLPGTKPLFRLGSDDRLVLARKPVPYDAYRHSCFFDWLYMNAGKWAGIFPPKSEDLTRALILEMKRIAESEGAHFTVLHWHWNEADAEKEFFERLETDVEVIDILIHRPAGWENMRLISDAHPNADAARHAAKLLNHYFVQKLNL